MTALNSIAPIAAGDVPAEWIDAVRVLLADANEEIAPDGITPRILIRRRKVNDRGEPGRWCTLMLPGSGTFIETAADRDEIIEKLTTKKGAKK